MPELGRKPGRWRQEVPMPGQKPDEGDRNCRCRCGNPEGCSCKCRCPARGGYDRCRCAGGRGRGTGRRSPLRRAGGRLRDGGADAVPAQARRHHHLRRRDRPGERRIPACAFPRVRTAADRGRFPEDEPARAFSAGTEDHREFPLQHLLADIFQGARAPRPGARMRRYDPEGGRRTDRGASGVEGVRHPERVVAGVVRHRIPLYGQRNGFQPAPQGQKRRYPPAPQQRRTGSAATRRCS